MRNRNYIGTDNGVTVDITRTEILTAFSDLLTYWESQEENNNIKAAKSAALEIIRNEVSNNENIH